MSTPITARSVDRPLRSRTALVTGASRGIGAASARRSAALGTAVVMTYRSGRDEAEELVADLRAEHAVEAHRLVTAVAPRMVERGFGRIVLVGSLHADGPTAPGITANGVSKAALAAYVGFAADGLTGPSRSSSTAPSCPSPGA